jgi:membrane-bound lytic murein transglycosylase MltF
MHRAPCAGVLALLLAGAFTSARAQDPSSRQLDEVQQALLQPFKGDWDEIRKRRMLRALVVYSRTLYFVDRGKQGGATYRMLKAFEDEVNARGGKKTLGFHVVFVPVSRADLIPALLDGRGDIAAAKLVPTPQRAQQVDFSASLLDGVDELVVTGPGGPAISRVDELAGHEVHVRRSSSYWEHLEALSSRLTSEGKPSITLVPAPEDLEDEDLLEYVNAGLIPITVCDVFNARFWRAFYPSLRFDPAVAVSRGGSVTWLMRKDSPQLKAVVDGFVRRHRTGTAFGNILLQQYQQRPRSVLPVTSGNSLRRFEQMVDLFRKYGKRYDVDPLLAMAQGYQESRLDQRVRSPVGAIGVMQLMPATGAQMRVGDIEKLEPNIHAGVKYLRHVVDTYFGEPALDALVKGFFAFASYNAGPNRIQVLRQETRRRGLDPDRWFGNVEYVVAERVGREPVTYVSNIFKYYVAYQRMALAEQQRAAAREAVQPAAR